MDQNWTNQNGIFQLSVAYMGPLATLNCHLEGLTPLTPVATHRVGPNLPKGQIYKGKSWKKSYASTAPIFTKVTYKIKMIIQSISRLSIFLVDDNVGKKVGKIRYHYSKNSDFQRTLTVKSA